MGASVESQRLLEVFSFDADYGILDARRCPPRAEMSEQKGGYDKEKYRGSAEDEFPSPDLGWRCLDHRLDYLGNLRRTQPLTGHLEFKFGKMVASPEFRRSGFSQFKSLSQKQVWEYVGIGWPQAASASCIWRLAVQFEKTPPLDATTWFGYTESFNLSGKTR